MSLEKKKKKKKILLVRTFIRFWTNTIKRKEGFTIANQVFKEFLLNCSPFINKKKSVLLSFLFYFIFNIFIYFFVSIFYFFVLLYSFFFFFNYLSDCRPGLQKSLAKTIYKRLISSCSILHLFYLFFSSPSLRSGQLFCLQIFIRPPPALFPNIFRLHSLDSYLLARFLFILFYKICHIQKAEASYSGSDLNNIYNIA